MLEAVWVLLITHKHGETISVFTTAAGADKALHDWVLAYKDEVGDPRDDEGNPTGEDWTAWSPEEAIQHYFDNHAYETYCLEQCEVKA